MRTANRKPKTGNSPHERRGVTPIIAVVILLLITVALAGTAWTYLSGYVGTQTQKTFSIVTNGAFCEGGVAKVYIVNTGYQAKLLQTDFTLAEFDGATIPIQPNGIEWSTSAHGAHEIDLAPGNASLFVEWDCLATGVGTCSSGYHELVLATPSTTRRERILCP